MNNSINYSGFVDLLKKPAIEMTHRAESLDEARQEPGLSQMVKPISRNGRITTEAVRQDE
jgi:hypothetical protein